MAGSGGTGDEGSVEEERILAGTRAGRLAYKTFNMTGGFLYLTARRLIFVPYINRKGIELSSSAAKLSAKLHDWPVHPQQVFNLALKPLSAVIEISLLDLRSVEPTEPRKQAALRFSWDKRERSRTIEFAMYAKLWLPSRTENLATRDSFLAEVKKARRSSSAS